MNTEAELLRLLKLAADNIQGCIDETDRPSSVIARHARELIEKLEGSAATPQLACVGCGASPIAWRVPPICDECMRKVGGAEATVGGTAGGCKGRFCHPTDPHCEWPECFRAALAAREAEGLTAPAVSSEAKSPPSLRTMCRGPE